VLTRFDVDKVDRLATRPRIDIEMISPLSNQLTPASGTSNIVRIISELCLKHPVNGACVCVFLKEKPNDYSLLASNPTVKNINVQGRQHFKDRWSLEAKARTPGSSARKEHGIDCLAMHEALLGILMTWPRPLLPDHFIGFLTHPITWGRRNLPILFESPDHDF
jgi:hypothetical protein